SHGRQLRVGLELLDHPPHVPLDRALVDAEPLGDGRVSSAAANRPGVTPGGARGRPFQRVNEPAISVPLSWYPSLTTIVYSAGVNIVAACWTITNETGRPLA